MRNLKENYMNKMLLAGSILVYASGCSEQKNDKLPNVIYILSDDIGPGDLGVYHRERTGKPELIPTPYMDYIAENGIRFRHASTPAAMCAPTRYSILSGNYGFRCRSPWGVWDAFDSLGSFAHGEITAAQVMKNAGYHTAFYGKWNLGSKWNKAPDDYSFPGKDNWDDGWDYSQIIDAYPNTLGFDYSFMLPQGIQALPLAYYRNGQWLPIADNSQIIVTRAPWDSTQTLWRRQYRGYMKADSNWDASIAGKMLTEDAVNFIHDHVNSKSGKPFFIYYCSQAVHLPHEPPEEFFGTPVKGTTHSIHGDMIVEFDLQVGKIIEALKNTGELNNTLIIVTSDNGGLNHEKTEINGHNSSNGYRGKKSFIYEGGSKVPFIAMWPDRIPVGVVSDELVMAHDLLASLYSLTNQDMPENQAMDSYNILPLLFNEPGAKGRNLSLYQGGMGAHISKVAIREGDWKLIINSDSQQNIGEPLALFNLKDNPFEDESENFINNDSYSERKNYLYELYTKVRTTDERTTEVIKARK